MPRSPVLRGQPEPRSRAKTRHRLDKRLDSRPDDPAEVLKKAAGEWLAAADAEGLESLMGLDLKDYLRVTVHIEEPASERLRRLAILVEGELSICLGSEGARWAVLERIYKLALSYTPADPDVLCSMGISLQRIAELASEDQGAAALWKRAIGYHRQAAQADPLDAHSLYGLGNALYHSPERDLEEVLAIFRSALAVDPAYEWAKLYVGHCLQDLERWSEALEAYSAIKGNEFEGNQAWRWVLIRELRAWCRLKSGDSAGALIEFEALVSMVEKALDAGLDWDTSPVLHNLFVYLSRAARGELAEALEARWAALEERQRGHLG